MDFFGDRQVQRVILSTGELKKIKKHLVISLINLSVSHQQYVKISNDFKFIFLFKQCLKECTPQYGAPLEFSQILNDNLKFQTAISGAFKALASVCFALLFTTTEYFDEQ